MKTMRASDHRIWLVGTDAEVKKAAAAFAGIDGVHDVTVVPEHDEPRGHVLAELTAEVDR